MQPSPLLVLASLAMVLAAGCSSTPVALPAATAAAPVATAALLPARPAAAAPFAAVQTAAPSRVVTVELPEYLDPKSGLSMARSVYFEFDDFSIEPSYQAVVERHGKFLSSHPQVAIRIEGSADERGSPEYNLALGQKRAEAVRRALQILGVRPSQMEAISWGEEKPKAQGHDESAWSQNRRADLQYPAR